MPIGHRAGLAQLMPKASELERSFVRTLSEQGFRGMRRNCSDLPGTPDIVFPSEHVVVFVHGCFWHSHYECRGFSRPQTNPAAWSSALERTIVRDSHACLRLLREGWLPVIVWECELKADPWQCIARVSSSLTRRGHLAASQQS